MRPVELEVEGFTAFRERTCVKFGDADLFALTGPTGAGKSSLIDAMIFALYGSVPRLGGNRVTPLISQGSQRARVKLDFTLGDNRYTAVRVVHDGKPSEVRLERNEDVLAAKAGEFDAQVEELIGLDFGQFTTCVVLPQGQFARFLNATPAKRQELLRQLLGLNVYVEMRLLAHERKVEGDAQLQAWLRVLDGLADVTKKRATRLAERLDAIEDLARRAEKKLAKLASIQGELDQCKADGATFRDWRKSLRRIAVPDAVKVLPDAQRELDNAQKELGLATARRVAAESARAELGDAVAYTEYRNWYANYERSKEQLDEATAEESQAREREKELSGLLAKAKKRLECAREAVLDAKFKNAAHELRGRLAEGEPCPVCEQTVGEIPNHKPIGDVVEREGTLAEAEEGHDAASTRRGNAQALHAAAKVMTAKTKQELDAAKAKLADVPNSDEVERVLKSIGVADKDVAEAKDKESSASVRLDAASSRLDKLGQHPDAGWPPYHRTRDELATLDPPKPSADLFCSWKELAAWAKDAAPNIDKDIYRVDERAVRLAKDFDDRMAMLAATFDELDVPFGDSPRDGLAEARAETKAALENTRKTLKEKKRLKRDIKKARGEVAVAETLWTHLHADRFEKWLLAEAFRRLSDGASEILKRLSNDRYSFRHSGSDFEVVDHANAGEARSARTLSGGETFLASLSLALALADQVADLATQGTARLESIFLDEGFGTLDPDTLDIAANSIEELGAGGRMVGVVTHVNELAERMPVQFKVSKAPGSATVERVES